MKYKKLNWNKKQDSFRNEYISKIKVNGLFGIKFICEYKRYNNTYTYKYIINGKHYGGYLGYECKNLEHGMQLCEEHYEKICENITSVIFE